MDLECETNKAQTRFAEETESLYFHELSFQLNREVFNETMCTLVCKIV